MKKFGRAIISIFLVLTLVFVIASPSFASVTIEGKLQFNDDGKFTIVQFADCQDDALPRQGMLKLMGKALDSAKPDLVIFTGDNVSGGGNKGKLLTKAAIKAMLAPVLDRGVPFAVVFGNHDAESGVSKEDQLEMYQEIGGDLCLAFDAVPSLYGCANYNLPILNSTGSRYAFNLWFFDSNEYADSGYDWVHDDQVQWYKDTSLALEQAKSGRVPSLAFQHIPPTEIYELLKEVAPGTPDSNTRFGKTWALELNPARAQGILGEWPCPSDTVSGQFQAFVDRKDVLGLVSGHDHVNDFVGTYKGVDIIQSPGISFQSYHDREVIGCRVIVLDENDNWHYQTETPNFAEYFGTGNDADYAYLFFGSEIASFLPFFADLVFALMKVISWL